MRLLARLALRNLGRRPVRTSLTMAAMAGATALLIVALGLLQGMILDMITQATETYYGQAVLSAPRYFDRRAIQLSLPAAEPDAAALRSPEVKGLAGRLRGFLLLSAGRGESSNTQPAEVLGVDPGAEREVSRLPACVKEGRFLSGIRGREMVLGEGLAKRLGARVGTEIAAMGGAADGSIAAGLYNVVGIADTGDAGRDSSLALVGLGDLQYDLDLEGRVHEWVVALRQPLRAADWARRTAALLPGVEVSPWDRFLPQISEMLKMSGLYRAIYAVVFYFAVVLVTMNTMYMALHERVREFAVMGAVGLTPGRLSALIVLEAAFMSAVSAALGGAAGWLLGLWWGSHPLDFSRSMSSMTWTGVTLAPVFRTAVDAGQVLFASGMTFAIGAVVSLLPAWRLLRLRPVEALREV